MPRRKPTSTRQKKASIQQKRAVKRGDIPPPDPKQTQNHRRHHGNAARSVPGAEQESARKLQSAFLKLPQSFLEETKMLASQLPLPRPIPDDAAILKDYSLSGDSGERTESLTCLRRPKWRFDMSKLEVERNEEGVFKKWLAQTDDLLEKWQTIGPKLSDEENEDADNIPKPLSTMPRSPSSYERNLEVWRQLWRVTEISQIILVLLDSRCPLLHFPPSLATYLGDRKVILVLTKLDISGPVRAQAWTEYLQKHYPGRPIVHVEAYAVKVQTAVHQGRKHYEPHLPETFRQRLVDAIRQAHAELLEPPENVKSNPSRLANWKPRVKQDINWDDVVSAHGGQVGSVVGGAAAPRPSETAENPDEEEPQFLTVGLIGQPNVGKSSLLNALFGASKVRASKTPGKTKHFQTLFWTPDIRLVDCPGLVMPNFVPMEMQVLSGILPISRISAVPSCIHFACQYLPVEKILNLTHPNQETAAETDKRTWRDGSVRPERKVDTTWTATDVLVAYANAKGWLTAKAGRPDIHRAGNAMLRAIAEGKIRWAFWPPGTSTEHIVKEGEVGTGVWIPGGQVEDESDEESAGEQEDGEDQTTETDETDGSEETDDDDDDVGPDVSGGRFGALAMNDIAEEQDDDTGSDSEES